MQCIAINVSLDIIITEKIKIVHRKLLFSPCSIKIVQNGEQGKKREGDGRHAGNATESTHRERERESTANLW
jgi:hypothetical protein